MVAMTRNQDLKKAAAVRFWMVPFLAAVLLKSVGQCQDSAYTCVAMGYEDTAALSCGLDLTGGLTLSLLQWRKIGLTPDDLVAGYLAGASSPSPAYSGRATINDTGFLLLTNITEADLGTYRCTQITLSDFSTPPDLANFMGITGPPTNIRCAPGNATVNEATEVNFACTTALPGCPPAIPYWDLPGNQTSGTLNFNATRNNHTAVFNCSVSNSFGTDACQSSLKVNFGPRHTSILVKLNFHVSVDKLYGSVRLEGVEVDAFPPAEIIWRKSGSPVELKQSDDMFHEVISDLENAGKYTCTAENMLGSISCGEFDVTVTVWKLVLVIVIPLLVVIAVIVTVVVIYCKKSKVLPNAPAEVKLQPVPSSQKVVMQWTAKSEGSYKVQYRARGSDDWTKVDVSTNSHPYYKHTVDFQKDGDYEVCVLVTNAKGETKSAVKEATVKASGHPGEADSPVSPLHGNKSDVPLVFMISEGQSHPPMKHKLDPIETKQKPAEKKSKKKRKRKKLNEVHASDEDLKPPEE